jgi:hypothetical protein
MKKNKKSSIRINPEDDFSPLGGYQPKEKLSGTLIIPPGKSKALIKQSNTDAATEQKNPETGLTDSSEDEK